MSSGIYINDVYIKGLRIATLDSDLEDIENEIRVNREKLLALIVNTAPILKSEYDGETDTHIIDEGPIRLNAILEEYDDLVFRRRMIWEAQMDLKHVTED